MHASVLCIVKHANPVHVGDIMFVNRKVSDVSFDYARFTQRRERSQLATAQIAIFSIEKFRNNAVTKCLDGRTWVVSYLDVLTYFEVDL